MPIRLQTQRDVNSKLDPRDLKHLYESGLTVKTILNNGLHTQNGALVIPYRHISGEVNGFARQRPHNPRCDTRGRPIKYEQPANTPSRAYFPKEAIEKLKKGGERLLITEGEKKALAIAQLGYAVAGIGGIYCGCKKGSDELIPDLADLPLQDREVYIVFDYDPEEETRNNSTIAARKLARALEREGVKKIYRVAIPPGPNGGKNGIDDYLAAQPASSRKDALEQLLAEAEPSGNGSGGDGNNRKKIIPKADLGEAAYHGPIGQFLRSVSPLTEATDAAILAHLLPALGCWFGPAPYVYAGGRQYARLNAVVCGPTNSGRKGTSLAPVDELMRCLDEPFWKAQRVGGLSTGEGLVARVADKKVWNDEDKCYEIEYTEKRLFVAEEEFSKLLAQIRRDGNILSQVCRESFDSGNLSVLTRGDPLTANGAHISIVGHITPEELFDRFNHIEMANGFGNRFLWFAVKSEKLYPFCKPLPKEPFETFRNSLSHWMTTGGQGLLRGVGSFCVHLAPETQDRWQNGLYQKLREDKPGFAGALTARGATMVLRIALIYSLLDPPPSKGASHVIAPVHLDAALAVWKYCEESAYQLFGDKTGCSLSDKILSLLENGPMSKDQINNHLSPQQKTKVQSTLESLEADGKIQRTVKKRESGAGRPTTFWGLVSG
jgi:hypothetical protein